MIIFMEDLKVSLRIASIVFEIIIYCCVWRYIMDSVTYYWVCYRRSLGLVLKIL